MAIISDEREKITLGLTFVFYDRSQAKSTHLSLSCREGLHQNTVQNTDQKYTLKTSQLCSAQTKLCLKNLAL